MRFALLCLFVACGGPQIQERKAADLTKLGPATLEARQPKEGEPREAKVRIWVDPGIRATPRWKEDITDQIDYAGQLITPLLGVRLKIDGFKDWNRTGDPHDALKELAKVDDGKEAAWVIGYVTPNDKASKAMGELGDAEILGRHVVVRGWAEKQETDALTPSLPDLKQAEKAEVLSAHKRHKQTVVLLHMLARSLGAIDEADPTWIQHPSYSAKQASFSDRNRELLQASVDHRLSDDAKPAIAHELVEKIEKEDWGGWLAPSKQEVVTTLHALVTAGKAGQAAPDVPIAAVEQFDRIKLIARKGEFATALAELENLLIAYPGNATIYQLKCELMLVPRPATPAPPQPKMPRAKPPEKPPAKPPEKPPANPPEKGAMLGGPTDKAARAACARVAELAPSDPSPHFAVAEALARERDFVGARAELKLAATKIAALKTGADVQWKRLVALYAGMGALTWTEEAVVAAKLENDPAAAKVAQDRARYGIPKGTKLVKPEDEAALVAAVRGALDFVYANKYADAQKAIAAGEKKWPGAAGFAAARCDLALRQAQLAPAKAACAKALAADPNESWALYLSGVISLKDTTQAGTKAGIEKLKKAIAVDPELGQAWRTLAKAYARAKDKAAFDQLAKDYAAKFGQPLPQQ